MPGATDVCVQGSVYSRAGASRYAFRFYDVETLLTTFCVPFRMIIAGVVLQRILVALISPNQASLLVKRLGPLAPLTGLRHLKRVRKPADLAGRLEIIICPLHCLQATAQQPECCSDNIEYRSWTEEELAAQGVSEAIQQMIREDGLLLRPALVMLPWFWQS